MKTKKIISLGLFIASAVTILASIAFAPPSEARFGKEPFPERLQQIQEMQTIREQIKHEIVNTDNGVVITISSDNPKVVKMIQDRAVNMGEMHMMGKQGKMGMGR